MTARAPVSDAAWAEVRDTLLDRLAAQGLERVDLQPDTGEDGREVIFVELWYARTDTPLDPRETFGLKGVIGAVLERHGDTRPLLLRHHLHENQPVAGWD